MFQGMADNILESDDDTTREEAFNEQATAAETKAGESVLATIFIKKYCAKRYGDISRELQND